VIGPGKRLWIATGNAKKRAEIERLLAPLGLEVRSFADLREPPVVVEDRDTFAGNAELKAATLARAVGECAIGDDSGLSVDALGGAPGVHSARWAGADASDRDRIDKLLTALAGVRPDRRRARFTCHVCLATGDGSIVARFEETCPGRIRQRPSGSAGFGYDPVFVADAYADRDPPPTFADLTTAEKDAVSHRGRALRALAAFLADPRRRQRNSP
jgi:XTP/dITP diphosphohydrolase